MQAFVNRFHLLTLVCGRQNAPNARLACTDWPPNDRARTTSTPVSDGLTFDAPPAATPSEILLISKPARPKPKAPPRTIQHRQECQEDRQRGPAAIVRPRWRFFSCWPPPPAPQQQPSPSVRQQQPAPAAAVVEAAARAPPVRPARGSPHAPPSVGRHGPR